MISTVLRLLIFLSICRFVEITLKSSESLQNLKAHSYKPIRWAGSKLPIASVLEQHIDFGKPYVEPFAGSAVLFFRNLPQVAYLNDLNSALIDFYKHSQMWPHKLWQVYEGLDVDKESYYQARQEFNSQPSSVRRSALFMYLNHLCFNGIYRTNLKNEFNTPFGGEKLKLIDKVQYLAFCDQVKDVSFFSEDFQLFLDNCDPRNSTIYMDPPYYTAGQRVFREYGPKTFEHDDLIRLDVVARFWADKGNRIVISYRECDEFRDLFSDCIVQEVDVARNVGGFKSRRNTQSELIAVLN